MRGWSDCPCAGCHGTQEAPRVGKTTSMPTPPSWSSCRLDISREQRRLASETASWTSLLRRDARSLRSLSLRRRRVVALLLVVALAGCGGSGRAPPPTTASRHALPARPPQHLGRPHGVRPAGVRPRVSAAGTILTRLRTDRRVVALTLDAGAGDQGRPKIPRDHQRRPGVDANAEPDDSPARVQDPPRRPPTRVNPLTQKIGRPPVHAGSGELPAGLEQGVELLAFTPHADGAFGVWTRTSPYTSASTRPDNGSCPLT
jgi:hypothetical protein